MTLIKLYKLNALQWKLIFIVLFLLFLFLFWVPYSNNKKRKNETFNGIVLNKYYKRGNKLKIKLKNDSIYSTYGINDADFDRIHLGDMVEMQKGVFIKW